MIKSSELRYVNDGITTELCGVVTTLSLTDRDKAML